VARRVANAAFSFSDSFDVQIVLAGLDVFTDSNEKEPTSTSLQLELFTDRIFAFQASRFMPGPISESPQGIPQESWRWLQSVAGAAENSQADERPIVQSIPLDLPSLQIEILEQWEGTVTEIDETSQEFTADLRYLRSSDDRDRLEAVFGFDSISPDDIPLLRVGALFAWTVQRETTRDGQVKNSDFLKFYRLPGWSKRDIDRIEVRAEQLKELFDQAR
jgi:hypothetical protein